MSTGGGAVGPFFFSAHFAFSSSSVLHIIARAAAENRRIPHQIVVIVATEGFSPCAMFSSMFPMPLSLGNSPRFFSCTSKPLTFSFFGPRCVFLRFQQLLYRNVCFSLFPSLPSPDTRLVSSHALTNLSRFSSSCRKSVVSSLKLKLALHRSTSENLSSSHNITT